MPIISLVECAVNLAENVTGVDIDRDGDIGMSKKQLDDANEEATPRSTMAQLDAPKFPVFDPATPKVSTLSIGMGVLESAIELVNEAKQQTAKFQPQASAKANFMRVNYDTMPDTVTGVTLANATGVRLEFFEASSVGLLKEYQPPSILEPGEVASFLVDNSIEFKLNYNIQTFQGPVTFGAGPAGWVGGDAATAVTVKGKDTFSTTIDAALQVDRTTAYDTQFTFDVSRKLVDGRPQWQISVTQSITGYSISGKAAVLDSGKSILLGGAEELGFAKGFAGGESWTIELWVRVDSIKSGGANDSDQAVFGCDTGGSQSSLHCVFRNGGRLHLDFYATDYSIDDPGPIQVNVWTHFALQFEKAPPPNGATAAGDLRIFRNGVLVAASRGPPLTGNTPLSLGKHEGGRPLLGKVAQVRLWNVAVPESEIVARLYTSGPSPSTTGPDGTPGLREVLDFAELEENNDSRINGIKLKTFEIKP